jgi:hypothetical protein
MLRELTQAYTCPNTYAAVVRCSRKFTPKSSAVSNSVVPIPCLSTQHTSLFRGCLCSLFILPLDCKLASEGMIPIPDSIIDKSIDYRAQFKKLAERIINVSDMTVYFSNSEFADNCILCERQGRRAFSSAHR